MKHNDTIKHSLSVGAVVLSALLLVGCSSGAQNSSLPNVSSGQGGQSDGMAEPAPFQEDGAASEIAPDQRQVVTTGSVSLTVEDPIEAAEDALAITEKAGGRVDSRTESPGTDNQPASANLTLRIPSDKLDASLAELKELGTVNHVSLNASDVTQQTQDLDARITSLQTSVDRLLGLMSNATDTADLITIESALSERQSELESLQSQRDFLSDQVDYSTLTLELYAEGVVAPGAPDNFWTGVVAGWNALVATLGGLLVGLGVLLPWLLVLAVVGAIVLLIVRLSTRKRRMARAVTPAQPAAPVDPPAPTG